MKKGIVMMAFGKRGYGFAAYNLALSIKHFNKDIQIALIHDETAIKQLPHMGFFDKLIPMKDKDYLNGNSIDPAKAKTGIYKYLPYDHNLYLDCDAIALKDITPLLDHYCKQKAFYLTDVPGIGKKNDVINYSIWAKHDDIWEFFDLNNKSVYPAIQSSNAYIKKGAKAEEFFAEVQEYYKKGFPLDKITMQWGGTVPDELLFSGVCAKRKLNPNNKITPIFFGWKLEKDFKQIKEDHYLLALYGNGKGRTLTKRRFIEWYDRMMWEYARSIGMAHSFKTNYILKDKHANG